MPQILKRLATFKDTGQVCGPAFAFRNRPSSTESVAPFPWGFQRFAYNADALAQGVELALDVDVSDVDGDGELVELLVFGQDADNVDVFDLLAVELE